MPITERVPERDTTARHRQYPHLQIHGHAPHQSETNGDARSQGPVWALLDALHDSRRRQAARMIHQYRHLIAAPRSVKPRAHRAPHFRTTERQEQDDDER